MSARKRGCDRGSIEVFSDDLSPLFQVQNFLANQEVLDFSFAIPAKKHIVPPISYGYIYDNLARSAIIKENSTKFADKGGLLYGNWLEFSQQ